MPRKRRTKAVGSKSKPKLPDGDEGIDLSERERKAKLEVFLKDFDAKVEAQKLKMQGDLKTLLSFVTRVFAKEMLTMNQTVKKMTLQEFLECGGTLDAALQRVGSRGKLTEPNVNVDLSNTAISARVLSRINPNFTLCDTIMEEEQDTSRKPTRKNDSVLSSTLKSKRGPRLNGSAMPPPAAPSSSFKNSRYQTPQHGRSLAATGWETPLITPKFDPRLPVTPAQTRDANPGEVLMSLGGSPISNPRDRGARGETISVKGKKLTVNLDGYTDLENLKIPDSSELENLPFKTQISTMMGVLSDILKKQQNGN